MRLIHFLPAAERDFDESLEWYSERSKRTAQRFANAIDVALVRISEQADMCSFVDTLHRQCSVKRFPFRIIFRLQHDKILIVAIAHAKRNPNYWLRRK
jgi:plasmid stabilization system protein ParE